MATAAQGSRHSRPHMVAVQQHPGKKHHRNSRYDGRDRMHIALDYLRKHDTLTAKKYAKLTHQSKERAQAELDAFARRRDNPIVAIIKGKKVVYTLAAPATYGHKR